MAALMLPMLTFLINERRPDFSFILSSIVFENKS
jgi:hypothetical protein